MAAAGPKARTVAAAKADIITLVTGPLTSRDEAARLTATVRDEAADRASEIEFASPIFVVGDEAPPWVQQFLRTDFATLVERDSLLILRGTPREMADELQRRRDALGVSYVSVNAAFADQFSPVIDLLAGR
jgi:alkanesulfonate monooxygenase SsuD/methylene tetrahydromethanopterin reductase-like flavin-dependent oxidoreductase (luciferase family)